MRLPLFILPVCALGIVLTGCGSRAPKTGETLDAAELAVARIDQARVADYASVESRAAHEKLAAARATAREAQDKKDDTLALKARWLAEEARVDAELAAARAQLAKNQAVLLQKQRALGIDPPQPPSAPAAAPGGQP